MKISYNIYIRKEDMIFRDSEGLIGLFYIIDDEIYRLQMTLDEGTIDSLNEIQPLYNHEKLLNELQFGTSYPEVKEELGYDLERATIWTFPRGRVWYNVNDKSFTIASSHKILSEPYYLNKVKAFFALNDKKIKLVEDNEYENYDESYLLH